MDNSPYLDIILSNVPRLLSSEDRNKLSPTYGCFDRSYWHLKFVTDFPSAHYQEISLILALLFQNKFEGNIYYQNPRVLEWAKAGLIFWTKIQNKDGSFNEAYPGEHSFVATAFSTYSVSEAYLLLEDLISKGEKDALLKAFQKAADWLINHNDLTVCNHQAGAVVALYNIYLITGEKKCTEEAKKKLNALFKEQSQEGWFPEYGGADLGYLSMSVDYLAKYYQKSKDSSSLAPLTKAVDFMAYFIGPDGSFSGDYNSRGVGYLCPWGLEILSGEINSARYILSQFYQGLKEKNMLTPANMDDRYTGFFLLKYLQAFLDHQDFPVEKIEFAPQPLKNFGEAKLLVINNENYYAVIGYNKNGVIKVIPKQSSGEYSNTGLMITLKDGKTFTSQWLNRNPNYKLSDYPNGSKMSISAHLHSVNFSLPLKKFLIPFRLFNYIFGRSDKLSQFLAQNLKSYKIKEKKINIEFSRDITLDKESILIEDYIEKPPQLEIARLTIADRFTQIVTSSANYFEVKDLSQDLISFAIEKEILSGLNKENSIRLFQEIVLRPGFRVEPYLIKS